MAASQPWPPRFGNSTRACHRSHLGPPPQCSMVRECAGHGAADHAAPEPPELASGLPRASLSDRFRTPPHRSSVCPPWLVWALPRRLRGTQPPDDLKALRPLPRGTDGGFACQVPPRGAVRLGRERKFRGRAVVRACLLCLLMGATSAAWAELPVNVVDRSGWGVPVATAVILDRSGPNAIRRPLPRKASWNSMEAGPRSTFRRWDSVLQEPRFSTVSRSPSNWASRRRPRRSRCRAPWSAWCPSLPFRLFRTLFLKRTWWTAFGAFPMQTCCDGAA